MSYSISRRGTLEFNNACLRYAVVPYLMGRIAIVGRPEWVFREVSGWLMLKRAGRAGVSCLHVAGQGRES